MEWLHRRPVSALGGAFIAGALAESLIPEHFPLTLFILTGFLCVIVAEVAPALRLWGMMGATFAVGTFLTRWQLPPVPSPLSPPFDGIVASAPLPHPFGYRLLLQVRNPEAPSGFVQLTIWSEGQTNWQIGDIVRVKQFWGQPATRRRERFLRVLWVGRAEEEALERIGHAQETFRFARLRERWRRWVFDRWETSLPQWERTFTLAALASLVFGMRTAGVTRADERAFARSGLAHLFVPSGSQVTLLMILAWGMSRYSGLPPLLILLSLLGFYLPLTRGEPSIYRAVLMGLYAFLGWRWFRDVDWQTSLWLSSALLVAVEPAMLHDVGFQLSYAATFGLLYSTPLMSRAFRWLPKWLRVPMGATLSAQLFVTPVLVHYFGRVSLIAPLANLCALPVASLALTLGLLSALLSLLSPLVAMPVSIVAGELAKLAMRMAHWFATPSWASIPVTPLSGWQTLLALAMLTALVAWLKKGLKEEENREFVV